jgi:hypothetical protein
MLHEPRSNSSRGLRADSLTASLLLLCATAVLIRQALLLSHLYVSGERTVQQPCRYMHVGLLL